MKRIGFMLLGLIAGVAVILGFYYLLSIPLIPCVAVWIAFYLSIKGILYGSRGECVAVRVVTSIVTLVGLFFYGTSLWATIRFFPAFGNVLAIIFDALTVLAFIGAWVVTSASLSKKY